MSQWEPSVLAYCQWRERYEARMHAFAVAFLYPAANAAIADFHAMVEKDLFGSGDSAWTLVTQQVRRRLIRLWCRCFA